jgi:hypothetical protein
MTSIAPGLIYGLCLISSGACAALLLRSWRRTRTRLLLYTALGFTFIAINNLFLVADMMILPSVDLLPWRQAATAAAIAVLIYGFTFEVKS